VRNVGKKTGWRIFRVPAEPRYPPSELIDRAAYGVVGEVVRAVAAQSEADPAAIIVQFLAAFGSLVGRRAYFPAERDRHYPNLFAVLVGETSRGRKGASWGQAICVFERLSPQVDEWLANCTSSGLSSGEGLIHALRDRAASDDASGPTSAPADRRLLVRESEFAAVLKMFQREGNTLSAVLRQAWDGETLNIITKHSAEKASGAHISVIGHITREKLTRNLSQTEVANGLGNRFLWLCVRRSKLLPEGGDEAAVHLTAARKWLRRALEWVWTLDETPLRRSPEASHIWRESYEELTAGEPGLAGALLARAEAQVMRLASIYALLHGEAEISRYSLRAALALWEYCEHSTRAIFGSASGDSVMDTILGALRLAPDGLARTQIASLFSKNLPGSRITQALEALMARGLVISYFVLTAGRSAEVFQLSPQNEMP